MAMYTSKAPLDSRRNMAVSMDNPLASPYYTKPTEGEKTIIIMEKGFGNGTMK